MRYLLLVLLISVTTVARSGPKEIYTIERLPDGVILTYESYVLQIRFCSPSMLNIRCTPEEVLPGDTSHMVTSRWEIPLWEMSRKGQTLVFETSDLLIELNTATVLCKFMNKKGELILEEKERAFSPVFGNETRGWNCFETFRLSPDEAIYGFGLHTLNWMNHRGKEVTLAHPGKDNDIPFLISTDGWGILWDNTSRTYFRDDKGGATFWSEQGATVDYYLFFGDQMDQVIGGYREATGQVPLFGKWFFGFWQGREQWRSAKEVSDVIAESRMRRLPLEVVVANLVPPDTESLFHTRIADPRIPVNENMPHNASVVKTDSLTASFANLRREIATGVNVSLTGKTYWTTCIGGWFVSGHDRGFGPGRYPDGCNDPAYRELFVRWFQFGAFCPIFRSEGAQTPRELWHFGDQGDWAYDAMKQWLDLRYRLLPYIYSVAWNATSGGGTLMRPLAMDFRDDKKVLNLDNEYLFGPAILVCPVTQEQYFPQDTLIHQPRSLDQPASVEVYLPKGANWIDFWTGESVEGGKLVTRETPIEIMPLYIRVGSIIPMGPFLQYASEKPADPIELRIYPGANGSFILYEDEGEGSHIGEKVYSTIPFTWEHETGRLLIGKRNGSFPGMLQTRTFRIIVVSPGHGAGVEITQNPERVVQYSGESLEINL